MILNNLTSKIAAFFLIGGFLLGCIFVVINTSNKLTQLRAEIKQLQAQLQNCKNTNQQLVNQIQMQQENYIKAQKQLEEASKKPPKRVFIRQVIKEPIYITNTECQQMADLIKQAEEQLK
jgi:cell division protein FtsB